MAMAMAMIQSLALFLTCIAAIWICNENIIASAASPLSPRPSAVDCPAVVYAILPCVNYITIGSTMTMPSEVCCKNVESVMKWNAKCMCVGLKQSESLGIQLNVTRAIDLPATCGISTPLSDCGCAFDFILV
ncbi:non-specific lipid-transfer protein-like protein At5g64080 [Cucurbita pepo subsp. pepo]|uniref:non-specific lipid-transfer protein-like protein At5g64080 n=1 Tax=Cucurbita pepo subsp. pepo TaxID=3664 RepID=UPI000C9D9A50|nr:non-specific lipid-transfer protein-like protein At5g64080 [Cucurbita pepo subsp. pepo]